MHNKQSGDANVKEIYMYSYTANHSKRLVQTCLPLGNKTANVAQRAVLDLQ